MGSVMLWTGFIGWRMFLQWLCRTVKWMQQLLWLHGRCCPPSGYGFWCFAAACSDAAVATRHYKIFSLHWVLVNPCHPLPSSNAPLGFWFAIICTVQGHMTVTTPNCSQHIFCITSTDRTQSTAVWQEHENSPGHLIIWRISYPAVSPTSSFSEKSYPLCIVLWRYR